MACYFLDSIAIVKRYVDEIGSGWIAELMDLSQGNALHAAAITEVEVVAALARRSQASGPDPQAVQNAVARFRSEFDACLQVVQIGPELIDRAVWLAQHRSLRGYDAVQLSAALRVAEECRALSIPFSLISADEELNTGALAEGLQVENPNLHP